MTTTAGCWISFAAAALLVPALSGCGGGEDQQAPAAERKINLTSPAFAHGEPISRKHTGQGDDVSPALNWSGVPDGTKELALVMDDPDAPAGTWVHWVLYKIPAGWSGLKEGLSSAAGPALPEGLRQGKNSWGKTTYQGPMPPAGKPHRYFFRLYALDAELDLGEGLTSEQFRDAIKGHILATGELMGTYQRR
jgi:Raf kinase inhibitor-like YbhB/YbcL family protein